jgi:hypothetical protein
MGTGYVRNDTSNNIADGNVINASDLDGEFDAVQAAFNASTGHSHDGTTGEGPQIQTAGIADDAVTGAKIDSTTTVTAASFVGPLTGNVAGDVTGDVTGNADTATALATARDIAGNSFDGTGDISIATTDLTDVTATATEVNVIDGDTTATATTLVGTDRVVVNDAGTMKQVAMTDVQTYVDANATITESQISDLQSYLTSFTETNDLTSAVTWADVPDENITASSVTQHQASLSITESQISDFGTYETADATILKDADIGVTVQAYDATIVVDADIANMLETTDIGSTVQAYDADTAKTDVAQSFTASQRGTVTADNDGSFDLNASNYFTCTPTGAIDLAFTNETAGQTGMILLVNTTPQVITVAADVFLSDADLTTINVAGTYLMSYYCPDGTNVYLSATPALTEGS